MSSNIPIADLRALTHKHGAEERMQKILRRVATAERVATKRQKAQDLRLYKEEKKQTSHQDKRRVMMAQEELEKAKQSIRDDWAMGPLSPRTDIGNFQDAYGTIGEARYATTGGFSLATRNARCRWAGGAYYLNLAVGDRVVLLDGPDKGRIGPVTSIDHDTAEVKVKDLNKVDLSSSSPPLLLFLLH